MPASSVALFCLCWSQRFQLHPLPPSWLLLGAGNPSRVPRGLSLEVISGQTTQGKKNARPRDIIIVRARTVQVLCTQGVWEGLPVCATKSLPPNYTAEKTDSPYSTALAWLRSMLSLLTVQCICGTRSTSGRPLRDSDQSLVF